MRLNKNELIDLEAHLEKNSYVYIKDICSYVEKTYGTLYTITGMTKLVHRLGFIYKKPKLVPGKLDTAKQEEFKYQYQLLKKSLEQNEAIYFMDSVHPQYQARARCGWIKKNQDKTLPTFSGWKRKHIIGAIDISNLNVVTNEHKKINGESIISFLKDLELKNQNKSKIYLICDNAGYHKSKIVKEHLKNSKIELIFLPPYSPNLNPIERLWKFMHKKVSNNKWYKDFNGFSDSIDSFFENIPRYKKNLIQLITDNFQEIRIDHFCNSSG